MALVSELPEQLQEFNSKLHVDRISSLPDELLINILNFLPTMDAFITTILSKRWSHLFKEVNNLDFDDDPHSRMFNDCVHEETCDMFTTFICKMLDSIKLSNLVRFHIKLAKSCTRCIFLRSPKHPWLAAILSPNTPITDLCIDGPRYCFPSSIFTCKTLCILKLNIFFVDFPDTVCLPCLKSLHVDQYPCLDTKVVARIFSGCPVLHDVFMEPLTWQPLTWHSDVNATGELSISGPSLTILKLHSGKSYYSGMPRPLVDIDAPMLKCFHYVGNLAKSHSIKSSDCLVEAHLEIFIDTCDYFMDDSAISHSARDLIRRVSSVKSLFISTHCVQALAWVEDEFPILRNLTRLELDCFTNLHITLLRLLKSTPFLEKLILPKGLIPVGFKDKDTKDQDNWGRHQIVPSCMKTHLKVIEIEHFLGLNEELRMVEYFLSNSYHLTQLVIHKWLGTKSRFKVRKQLKRLGRRRKNCVDFSELCL